MAKITTFLWFDREAEDAARFYCSLFTGAQMGGIQRFGKDAHGPEGKVMTASFTLFGQEFVALNGGPEYQHTPATSFLIQCADQTEIDRYWNALTEKGTALQCGWVTDRFGVTWQIVPAILFDLMNDPDAEKAGRVTQAMLKMVKLDIAELQRAYNGS